MEKQTEKAFCSLELELAKDDAIGVVAEEFLDDPNADADTKKRIYDLLEEESALLAEIQQLQMENEALKTSMVKAEANPIETAAAIRHFETKKKSLRRRLTREQRNDLAKEKKLLQRQTEKTIAALHILTRLPLIRFNNPNPAQTATEGVFDMENINETLLASLQAEFQRLRYMS